MLTKYELLLSDYDCITLACCVSREIKYIRDVLEEFPLRSSEDGRAGSAAWRENRLKRLESAERLNHLLSTSGKVFDVND